MPIIPKLKPKMKNIHEKIFAHETLLTVKEFKF